jgi:hypothetical protein
MNFILLDLKKSLKRKRNRLNKIGCQESRLLGMEEFNKGSQGGCLPEGSALDGGPPYQVIPSLDAKEKATSLPAQILFEGVYRPPK